MFFAIFDGGHMNRFLEVLMISAVFMFIFSACSDDTEKFVTKTTPECRDYHPMKYTRETENDAEREIAESDIYKLDGDILWLINFYKGLVAVDISDPANMKILDSLRLEIKNSISGIYLQNGRAYLITDGTKERDDSGKIHYSGREITRIPVINTEDPSNLSLVTELETDGEFIGAVQIGDIIYALTEERGYSWTDCKGKSEEIGDNRFQISITSINIKDPQNTEIADRVSEIYSFDEYESIGLGINSSTVYASQKALYIAKDAQAEPFAGRVAMFDISDSEGKIVKKADLKTMGFTEYMYESDNIFFAVSNGVIESFDVSDPENIKQLDRSQQYYYLETIKFDGDRIYAAAKIDYFSDNYRLYVFDISDPANIVESGHIEAEGWFGSSFDLEVIGTKLLTFELDSSRSRISLYDVSDPGKPKEINTITTEGRYSSYNRNPSVTIFNELGLILYPLEYELYLIGFDSGSGLKIRSSLESSSQIIKGIMLKDLVFTLGFESIVAADAKNLDKPEVLSEINLLSASGHNITAATRCGKFLCGINESVFAAYDAKTFEKVWESSSFIDTDYYSRIVTNSRYAYIYNNGKVKIIKLSEDGRFEELGLFPLAESFYSASFDVSENNVIALGKRDKEKITLSLFDMNDPENGIKTETFNFDYQTLTYERDLFTGGSTFWESGCELKTKNDTKGNRYYCYAFPFDASDPNNPKAGKKINIPGELAGVSDDGKYLYTLTPEFNKNECEKYYVDDLPYYGEYELYILKLNDGKTSVEVVAQENLADSSYLPFGGVTSNYIYVKNDTVFILETSTDDSREYICYDGTERDDKVRILSADTGKEIYNRQFENTNFAVNVKYGGLLVSTLDGWTYISPDGKEKSGSDDISQFSEAGFLLVDETLCIKADSEVQLTLNVK